MKSFYLKVIILYISSMIVPVRCFNCNKVLAHLWEPYQQKLQEATNASDLEREKKTLIIGLDNDKTVECRALDELGIERYCCRAAMMGTVVMTNDITKTSYSSV